MKTNKSDYIDVEVITEAVAWPTMHFVSVKTDEQPDLQSQHRALGRWVMRRTAVINQIRGSLLEQSLTGRRAAPHACLLTADLEDAGK